MDVKTLLRTDRVTRIGKNYRGVLMRDGEDHYTFLESHPATQKRNPHIYMGKYINRYSKNFTFQDFCREAAEELIVVTGLVESEK